MRRDIVYLGYENAAAADQPADVRPTLYDQPGDGRVEALWVEDADGNITITTLGGR